ncbi:hypothetical protein LTR84_005373 [Exophiala bonariae]|uniref:Transcription factor Iwr1 domain-containing protein n=1 Tax=Exophiala bonariae TaxID=1690606 RepID=A0AAV9N3L6_9EURO|nr:hypothetical protein LTR84_005373 [Exophiala bonariae]
MSSRYLLREPPSGSPRYELRERASSSAEPTHQPPEVISDTAVMTTENIAGEFRVGKPWKPEVNGIREPYFAPTAEAVDIIFQHHAIDSSIEHIPHDINFTTDHEPLFHIGDKVYTRAVSDSSDDETDQDDTSDDDEDEFEDDEASVENDEAVDTGDDADLADDDNDKESEVDDESTEPEQAFEILEIRKGYEIFHLLKFRSQEFEKQSDDRDLDAGSVDSSERQSEIDSEDEDDFISNPDWTSRGNEWFYRLDMSDSTNGPVPLVAFWHESQLEFAPLATDDLSECESDGEILTDIPINDDSDSEDGDTAMDDAVAESDSPTGLADIPSAQGSDVVVIDDDEEVDKAITDETLEEVKKEAVADTGIAGAVRPTYPSLPNLNLDTDETDTQGNNSAHPEIGEKRRAENNNFEEDANPHNAKRRRFWNW